MARRTDSILDKLRKSWWFAWLAALILALTHLKDAVDGLEKFLVITGVKPDALAIASSSEKGAFSREFSEVAWRRLFWARAVVGRAQNGWQQDGIDEAYKNYLSASETWHTKMMTFILYTERFYGAAKTADLEHKVTTAMNTLAEEVAAVKSAAPKTEADYVRANRAIDGANDALFYFVRGFSAKKSGA